MRLILPKPFFRKPTCFGSLLMVFGLGGLTGCKHVVSDPPVKPGPPISAAGDVELETADAECAGLVAALDSYGKCPNLDEGDRHWAQSAIEATEKSFAAGKKANADEPSLHAIAMACHRATESMRAATVRCMNGKRPRTDWE
jgi:hypothetical protein